MVENLLRRLIEHRSRRWIVIILTLVVGLLVTWPLADDYLAQHDRRGNLVAKLFETKETVGRREMFQARLEKQREQLVVLESRSLPESSMFEFRGQIAEIARDSGCQVRQMRLGKTDVRRWRKDDHPLATKKEAASGKSTPLELRSQQFSLSVFGPVAAVKSFLGRLNEAERFVHAKTLAVRPEGSESHYVELNLELLLFDLQAIQTKGS